ncbi:MAG: MFS transporter [Pseudomonadota bacterium]
MSRTREVITGHIGLLLAGSAAYSMSTLFSAMKPVLLTRFVEENGWSDGLAGVAVAMPFVGIALASLLASTLAVRFSLRALALGLGGILITAEVVSALAPGSVEVILLAQLLGGIAVGVLMGSCSRIIATQRTPGPLFGMVDMIAVLLMSSMIALIGAAVQLRGLAGGYGAAAGVALVLTIAMLAFRDSTPKSNTQRMAKPLVFSARALATVLMAVIFVTCSGLGFTYMFTVAQNLGMTYAEAGRGIGLLLLVSAGACLAGGWVSSRVGPVRPLAVAFFACAMGWYCVIHAGSALQFYVALVPAIFSLQFNFPVLLDLAGSLDEDGRWGAISAPLQTSGFAWAAILAGWIVGRYGIDALPIATGFGMAICLGLLVPIARFRHHHLHVSAVR